MTEKDIFSPSALLAVCEQRAAYWREQTELVKRLIVESRAPNRRESGATVIPFPILETGKHDRP